MIFKPALRIIEQILSMKTKEQRFEACLQAHKGIFFKVAKTYCQNEEDRQDLMQEMKLQLWQSFEKYKEAFKMSTWLYRICLNVAISFYRKNAFRKGADMPLDEKINIIQDTDKSEQAQHIARLEQCIQELNDLDKALMLLYLDDKSHAEIADIIGISVSNVATKVGRIKEKLKKRFSLEN